MTTAAPYPAQGRAARARWVEALRGPRNHLDPWHTYGSFAEQEIGANGSPISTSTLLLTNRECPYRCVMCDLWVNTLPDRVPRGAIPAQIRDALNRLPPATQIKLYNAGSFFDPAAVPEEDYAEIAALLAPFERVIVECHPKLIGERCCRFRDMLTGRLEVAIGLETAEPDVLERLNKGFDLADFEKAARQIVERDMSLRVFLLVRPPFMDEGQGLFWAKRSLDASFDAGAEVCCLIPTRGGNGAMEALAAAGDFAPPLLSSLEAAQEVGIRLGRGRVFADLWEIERFTTCRCSMSRIERIMAMNATQRIPAPTHCGQCKLTRE